MPIVESKDSESARSRLGMPDAQARELTPDAVESLPSLLKYRMTWRLLGWWTVAYGLSSWIIEYLASKLDRSAHVTFLFASNRLVYAVVWSGAIIVAIVATEWRPVTSARQVGRIVFHAGVCVAVTLLWGIVAYYLCLLVVPGWQPLGVARMLSSTAKNVLFGYGLVVVVVHITLRVQAHRAHEVALLRQAHLAAQAQLQVLKLEMQPHFLFNALHSISALIDSDPAAANDTLVLVSDMLRHAVETSRVQEVSLREEIRTVRLYTQIQQVRFGERLQLAWEIDDETLDAAVPHMLLQPLIENAIKHGIEVDSTAGRIEVRAMRDREYILITIRDDGPGCSTPSPRRGPGKGVANVRSRLSQLYPERYVFELVDAPGGGAQVTIRIPFIAMAAAPGVVEPAEKIQPEGEPLGAKTKRELMSA
ncbi:MAG TPA: histidine kinase [Gemmatimonadaceae bacterium]